MTAEEIKQSYSMRDVVRMYGFQPNRAGFIFCPFHNEKGHASMKIYQKDYNCFGCGANGDIFTFIQKMEDCSFRDAFLKLGGTYDKQSDWEKRRFEYELQKKKEKAQRELEAKKKLKKELLADIKLQKIFKQCFPVFSDDWCYAVNKLEKDFYLLEELNKEGVRLYG